jgi:hypothetical protein
MIETLVAFGCSNTYGSETIDAGDTTNPKNIYHAYPYFLSQKFSVPINYINLARVSASNLEIAYKVYNYIIELVKQKRKNVFIVIGWSGDERFPLFKKGEFGTMRPKTKPLNLWQENTTALNSIFRLFFFETPISTFLNALIRVGISLLLERYEIPYITIPTILYHTHPLYDLLDRKSNILCYDQNENIIFNYHNFKQPRSTSRHLTECEQKEFAEWLYNYIIANKTL